MRKKKPEKKKLSNWLVGGLVLLALLIPSAIKTSKPKRSDLRNYLSKTVVRIFDEYRFSGGTGFHIKTRSGEVLLLTNGHVCQLAEDEVLIAEHMGREKKVKIIKEDPFSDLCVVEPFQTDHYLTLSGLEPNPGEMIHILGHPGLLDQTMVSGEYIQKALFKVGFSSVSKEDCDATPKYKYGLIGYIFGVPIQSCYYNMKSYVSNAFTIGGNSGSPVVNDQGNVIGVLFAGSAQQHISLIVTWYQVKEFLSNF